MVNAEVRRGIVNDKDHFPASKTAITVETKENLVKLSLGHPGFLVVEVVNVYIWIERLWKAAWSPVLVDNCWSVLVGTICIG